MAALLVTDMITKKPQSLFALDSRSLALMRIGAGFFILWDLILRLSDFSAHFGPQAVFSVEFARQLEQLPRQVVALTPSSALMSLHTLSGSALWQGLLFALTFVAVTSYAVGYKTRLSAFVSLILIMSMHNRNIMMLYPGDDFSRLVLFFSCFLQVGQVWSIDSQCKVTGHPATDFGFPTLYAAAYILFISWYFSIAGFTKLGSSWKEGLGVYYLISRESWTTGLGGPIVSRLWLLHLLNEVTWYGESLLPILFLLPWRNQLFRTIGIVLYVVMLICFRVFIATYHVSQLGIVLLIGALPAYFWTLVRVAPPAEVVPRAAATAPTWARSGLAGFFAAMMLLHSWSEWHRVSFLVPGMMTPPFPEPIRKLALFVYASNPWRVYFVETKKLQDGWIVPRGYSSDGKRDLNLATGEPFSLTKPKDFVVASGGFRWWRFYYRVYAYKPGEVRNRMIDQIADYHCRRALQQGLDAVEIILMELPGAPPLQPRPGPVKKVLATRQCLSAGAVVPLGALK